MNDTGKLGILNFKPNYNIYFHRGDTQVGVLDFNGPEMKFSGDMDESAKLFLEFIATSFKTRLEQERAEEREALEAELLKLKKGIAGPSDYIQGRWDLIGEFQDVIRERGQE